MRARQTVFDPSWDDLHHDERVDEPLQLRFLIAPDRGDPSPIELARVTVHGQPTQVLRVR